MLKHFDFVKKWKDYKHLYDYIKELHTDIKKKNYLTTGNTVRKITEEILEILLNERKFQQKVLDDDRIGTKINAVNKKYIEKKILQRDFLTHLTILRNIGNLYSHKNEVDLIKPFFETAISSSYELCKDLDKFIFKNKNKYLQLEKI